MLIAFEGLDQSGKETQAKRLAAHLARAGHVVHTLSFPDYATALGAEIAKALAGDREYGPDVMQLLYVANRSEIKPRLAAWLDAGDVVVCDRYRASSVAYGEAFGLSPDWLEKIQLYLPETDITILLDIAPETAAHRKAHGRDRFERDMALLTRVRASYRRQAAAEGWILIDAEGTKDDVARRVEEAVQLRLAPPSTPAPR
jgi:dTMP kinase